MALVSSFSETKVNDLDVVLLHDKVAWFDIIVLYAFCVDPCKMLDDASSKEDCTY